MGELSEFMKEWYIAKAKAEAGIDFRTIMSEMTLPLSHVDGVHKSEEAAVRPDTDPGDEVIE